MTTALRISAAAIAALGPGLIGCSRPWIELRPAGAGFSVLVPVTPETTVRSVTNSLGSAQEHTFLVADAPHLPLLRRWLRFPSGFHLSYRDQPRAPRDQGEAESLLNEERDRFLKEGNGTLVQEQRLPTGCGPCAAREIVVRSSGDLYARVRMYQVMRRLYRLGVGTSEGQVWSARAEEFFRSFKLEPEVGLAPNQSRLYGRGAGLIILGR